MYYYSFSHSAETQYINSLFYTQIRFTEYSLFSVVRVICLDFMSALDVQIQKKLLTITKFPLTYKSRKENPQKPTQLSSRSHPRHLVGKRTAQKTPS